MSQINTHFLQKVLVSVGILVLAAGCGMSPAGQSASPKSAVSASPQQLKAWLPDSIGQNKPVILDFYSKFCLECQLISPKLEKIVAQNPSIRLVKINLLAPQGKQKYMIKAFRVVTAPHVVFINRKGQVKQTLLQDANEAELKAMTQAILRP